MKTSICCILVILIFFSCNYARRKNSDKIEIYLVKDRIETTRGIKISETKLDSVKFEYLSKRLDFEVVRYDTITDDYIFAGPFNSKKTDLEKLPFISDSELIKFNPNKNIFTFDLDATEKISKLDKNDSYGKQFVITINGKPELNGYFYTAAFTFGCHTNHLIQYDTNDFELLFDIKYSNEKLQDKFPKLYSALELSNRIESE